MLRENMISFLYNCTGSADQFYAGIKKKRLKEI
jgi:hypothetical protein